MDGVITSVESQEDLSQLRALVVRAIGAPLKHEESQAFWRSLAEGRLTAVDSFFHDGRAQLVLLETERESQANRIDASSWQLFESVMLGTGRKELCFDRKLHSSALAQRLKHTLANIGLDCTPARVPLVLVLLAHSAGGRSIGPLAVVRLQLGSARYVSLSAHVSNQAWAGLSSAERTVLALRAVGKSHADIAQERNTSRRTVANQLAAATHRLGVSGRFDLLRMLAAAG